MPKALTLKVTIFALCLFAFLPYSYGEHFDSKEQAIAAFRDALFSDSPRWGGTATIFEEMKNSAGVGVTIKDTYTTIPFDELLTPELKIIYEARLREGKEFRYRYWQGVYNNALKELSESGIELEPETKLQTSLRRFARGTTARGERPRPEAQAESMARQRMFPQRLANARNPIQPRRELEREEGNWALKFGTQDISDAGMEINEVTLERWRRAQLASIDRAIDDNIRKMISLLRKVSQNPLKLATSFKSYIGGQLETIPNEIFTPQMTDSYHFEMGSIAAPPEASSVNHGYFQADNLVVTPGEEEVIVRDAAGKVVGVLDGYFSLRKWTTGRRAWGWQRMPDAGDSKVDLDRYATKAATMGQLNNRLAELHEKLSSPIKDVAALAKLDSQISVVRDTGAQHHAEAFSNSGYFKGFPESLVGGWNDDNSEEYKWWGLSRGFEFWADRERKAKLDFGGDHRAVHNRIGRTGPGFRISNQKQIAPVAISDPENHSLRFADPHNTARKDMGGMKIDYSVSHVDGPTSLPKFFIMPEENHLAGAEPIALDIGTPKVAVQSATAKYPTPNYMVPVPSFTGAKIVGLKLKTQRNRELVLGEDFDLLKANTGALVAKLRRPTFEKISVFANFAEAAPGHRELPEKLANLDKSQLEVETKVLREAGFTKLADRLDALIKKSPKVSLADVEIEFKKAARYSYLPSSGHYLATSEKPYARLSLFLNSRGMMCAQCDGTNELFTEFAGRLFRGDSSVTVIRVGGYARSPNDNYLFANRLHANSHVRFDGETYLFDVTPPKTDWRHWLSFEDWQAWFDNWRNKARNKRAAVAKAQEQIREAAAPKKRRAPTEAEAETPQSLVRRTEWEHQKVELLLKNLDEALRPVLQREQELLKKFGKDTLAHGPYGKLVALSLILRSYLTGEMDAEGARQRLANAFPANARALEGEISTEKIKTFFEARAHEFAKIFNEASREGSTLARRWKLAADFTLVDDLMNLATPIEQGVSRITAEGIREHQAEYSGLSCDEAVRRMAIVEPPKNEKTRRK